MKEAGRSIGATRSIGSVATIGRIGNSEGAARFFAPSITSKPLGRTIGPTRAFGAKDHVFSTPSQERNPSRKINIGKLEPYNFLSSVSTNIRPANGMVIESRSDSPLASSQQVERGRPNHRRRPGRVSRTHDETPRSTRMHDVRNNAPASSPEFPTIHKPRFHEPIIAGKKSTDGEKALSILSIKSMKRAAFIASPEAIFRPADNHKSENQNPINLNSVIRFEPSQKLAKAIDLQSIRRLIEASSQIAQRLKVINNATIPFPHPITETIPSIISLPRPELARQALMERKTAISSRLRRAKVVPDEDLELDEDTRLKAKLATEVKTRKNTNTDNKQKLKEVILSAFGKLPKQKEIAENKQIEDDEIKYGVDKPTDKLRAHVISALRRLVVDKSKLMGEKPSWGEVAYLFKRSTDKSLESELVRGSKYKDNTLALVEQGLAREGTIYPLSNPANTVILNNPAVTLPRKQVEEVVPLSYVRKVVGEERVQDQAA